MSFQSASKSCAWIKVNNPWGSAMCSGYANVHFRTVTLGRCSATFWSLVQVVLGWAGYQLSYVIVYLAAVGCVKRTRADAPVVHGSWCVRASTLDASHDLRPCV